MKEQGVGVVGVVLDTVSDGSEDSEAIQKAQLLREKTGASYPFLIPDDSMMTVISTVSAHSTQLFRQIKTETFSERP